MRLQNLDLNLLIVLDALLREQNVARAAVRLHVSQPAISSALRRLRVHFADELLVAYGRRMKLTPFAEQLRRPVRQSMLQLQAVFLAKGDFDPATATGGVLIVASDYVVTTLLAGVLGRVARLAPELCVEVIPPSSSHCEMLLSGEADLVITPEEDVLRGHPHRAVFRDEFCAVVWSGNRRVEKSLSRELFFELRHIVSGFGDDRCCMVYEFLRASGRDYRTACVMPGLGLTVQAVVGTQHIACVPRRLAELYAKQLPIRVLPPPIELPPLLETVQWHRQRDRDALNLWLRGMLLEACGAQLGGPGLAPLPASHASTTQ